MEKEEQGFSEEGSDLVPSVFRVGFYYTCEVIYLQDLSFFLLLFLMPLS